MREGQRSPPGIHHSGSGTRAAAWFTAARSRRSSGASSMTARCNSAGIVSKLSGGLSAHCQKRPKASIRNPPAGPGRAGAEPFPGRRRAIDLRVKSAMRQQRASTDHPDFMSSRARCPLFEASSHTNLAIAFRHRFGSPTLRWQLGHPTWRRPG